MAITITKQPTSIAAVVGDSITFAVVATGVSAYQWQYNPGNKWYDLTDWETADSASLTFATTASRMTWQYRCMLTDDSGNVVYTDTVKIIAENRGLIARETLTAIADAIRAKTEATDRMLPEEMVALIEGIGGEIYTGSVTVTNNTYTLDLGVTLPVSDNYVFMLYSNLGGKYDYNYIAYIRNMSEVIINGVAHVRNTIYNSISSDATLSISTVELAVFDPAAGMITGSSEKTNNLTYHYGFKASAAVTWAYATF